MQKKSNTIYANTPFRIECESINNGENYWDSTKVTIFRDNLPIGEYMRNYPSAAEKTFYPFKVDEQWYALYSAHYTSLRVMKLHDDRIEDWCGNEPAVNGFCPIEVYVPQYRTVEDGDDAEWYADCGIPDDSDYIAAGIITDRFVTSGFHDFGFVAGCSWGDDSSWKLRYIELDEVPNKILKITEKFGYWELPDLPLKKCIDMHMWAPDEKLVKIASAKYFFL